MKERKESRKPGSDTRYTYAVGRIKALEARLLSPGDMERLLEEKTQTDVLQELAEFPDYADIFAAGVGGSPEEMLEAQLRQAYELVSELSLGSKVIKTLRLKYDFYNLKVLLKARRLGTEPERLFDIGFLSPEDLQRIIDERSPGGAADPFVGETILTAVTKVREEAGPEEIESTLDRFYYEVFLKNMSVNGFLEEYARRIIDLINLRTFWRIQLMDWPQEKLTANLMPGGTIEPSFLLAELATPMEDLLPKLTDDAYRAILREARSAYRSNQDLSMLDRLADDFLIQFLRKAKHYCFGLEPLVGYLVAKENEVMRLRILLCGKERVVPEETVRALFRISYA